jgi:hypothetical protein
VIDPATEAQSKNDAILALLADHPDGLSVHRIVKLLEERGVVIKSTGQAIGRLRILRKRGQVEAVEGDQPDWKKWRLVP